MIAYLLMNACNETAANIGAVLADATRQGAHIHPGRLDEVPMAHAG